MAGTTADKLVLLKATKSDLKAALTEKGQNPGDVFSAYPGMVRAIDTQEDLNAEMTAQDSLIAQIATALEGKMSVAGEPGTCTVTLDHTDDYGDFSRPLNYVFARYVNGECVAEKGEAAGTPVTIPDVICGSVYVLWAINESAIGTMTGMTRLMYVRHGTDQETGVTEVNVHFGRITAEPGGLATYIS